MVRLDSLKLQIQDDCIDSINQSFIKESIDRQIINGEPIDRIKDKKLIGEGKVLGLKDIHLFNSGAINVELSAKILKGNYSDLINRNNLEYMVDCLNENKGIQFNKNRLIESAKILSCDCTQNLEVSRDKQEYFTALYELRSNPKYNTKPYEKKGKFESIVFERDVKNKSSNSFERLVIYDKYNELLKSIDKKTSDENKELVKKYLKRNGLDWFMNKLRFERRFNHFENIRNSFSIHGNYLLEVLSSPENVILQLFEKINKNVNTELFDKWRNEKSFKTIEQSEGMGIIIEKCNYDIKLIKHFIQGKVKGNVSSYLKRYKDKIRFLIDKDSNDFKNGYIDEIVELIKTA